MLAVRKDTEFVKVQRQPVCFSRQVHKSIFDDIGHRTELHDLFHCGLVARDSMNTSLIVVTNPANFLEARFWLTSGWPTNRN